jgi:hypothetical protein
MAFPTTGVLDTFTGTDNLPLATYSANWSALITDYDQWKISSNRAVSGANVKGELLNYWNVAYDGNNVEVYFTFVTKPDDGKTFSIYLIDSLANGNGYKIQITVVVGSSNDTIQIKREDSYAETQLGLTVTQEISSGDSIGFSRISGVITLMYKPSGGSWSALTTRSDSTYTGNMIIVLDSDSYSAVIDDFGGGTVVSTIGKPRRRVIISCSS